MLYKVFHSNTFDEELEKHPLEFKRWLEKIEDQLVENPYVGDQIRVPWCREKKHDKFRVYYLIYDDLKSVLMVAISSKKDQQKAINTIFLMLDIYKDEILELLKKFPFT